MRFISAGSIVVFALICFAWANVTVTLSQMSSATQMASQERPRPQKLEILAGYRVKVTVRVAGASVPGSGAPGQLRPQREGELTLRRGPSELTLARHGESESTEPLA